VTSIEAHVRMSHLNRKAEDQVNITLTSRISQYNNGSQPEVCKIIKKQLKRRLLGSIFDLGVCKGVQFLFWDTQRGTIFDLGQH
jgi:hypothetical protein